MREGRTGKDHRPSVKEKTSMKGPSEETPGRVAGVAGLALGVVLVTGLTGTGLVLVSGGERTPAPSPQASRRHQPTPAASGKDPSTAPDRVSDRMGPTATAEEPIGTDSKGGKIAGTSQPGKDVPDHRDSKPNVYVVREGDTLSGLSRRFGISVDKLAVRNEIADVHRIYEGSTLVIPRD